MYQHAVVGFFRGVNVMAMRDPKGRTVSLQNADASDEVSVWVQSANHFRRWRDGDPAALDDLVRSLTPVLWHVVRAYGLEKEQAEDVVQTAWLTLVRRHETIADPQAVAAWLTTTARREAWRVSRVDEPRRSPWSKKSSRHGSRIRRPPRTDVVQSDEQDRLWGYVSQLSPRCQRLMRIVAFDDRPDYAGIAAELSMPIGSIGPTRGRCLDKLKTLLNKDGGRDHE